MNREKEKLAFSVDDRDFNAKAWYLKDTEASKGDSLIEIRHKDKLIRSFLFPSYKIWNIAAHFADMARVEFIMNEDKIKDWCRERKEERPMLQENNIRPFTKEDFEAAIEASGWRLDKIGCCFVSDEQFKKMSWTDRAGITIKIPVPIFVHEDSSHKNITEDSNEIVVRHGNGNRFTWTRPTTDDQPFKVGNRVIHKIYGLGIIEYISQYDRSGDVRFDSGITRPLWFHDLKHAPVEEQETKPEPPKPKPIEYEYTHSAELVNRWGDLITIPDPDSSWEMIEEKRDQIDLWPSLHVGNFGKRTIIVRTTFDSGATKETNLKVIHENGMMYLSEYVVRARQEAMRILSYKKFRRPIDNDPVVEEIHTYSGSQTLKTLAKEPVSECEWPSGSRPERKYVK